MKKLVEKIMDYLNELVEKARISPMVPAKSYVKISQPGRAGQS